MKIIFCNLLVISTGNQIWFVATVVIIDVIDALFVTFQSEVWHIRTQGPHFDHTIKTSRSKGVGILRVERQMHHKMRVAFKDLVMVVSST